MLNQNTKNVLIAWDYKIKYWNISFITKIQIYKPVVLFLNACTCYKWMDIK